MAATKEVTIQLNVKAKDSGDLQKIATDIANRQGPAAQKSLMQGLVAQLGYSGKTPGGAAVVGGALGAVIGSQDSFIGILKASLGALGPAGIAAAVAITGVETALHGLQKIASDLVATVAKANPFIVERLNRAWDDANAVIGSRFIPFVKLMTDAVRALGDVLQTVLPSQAEFARMTDAMRPALDATREAFMEIALALKPLISLQIGLWAAELRVFAIQLQALGKIIEIGSKMSVMGGLSRLMGNKEGSSIGAAYRPAEYQGFAELGEQARLRVAGLGGMGPQERAASGAERTANAVEAIQRWLEQNGIPRETQRSAADLASAAFSPMGGLLDTLTRGMGFAR